MFSQFNTAWLEMLQLNTTECSSAESEALNLFFGGKDEQKDTCFVSLYWNLQLLGEDIYSPHTSSVYSLEKLYSSYSTPSVPRPCWEWKSGPLKR